MKILAIDWGQKRVGLALGNTVAKLAKPYRQLAGGDLLIAEIAQVVQVEAVELVIVGLPRNLAGEETQQSVTIREFAHSLSNELQCPIKFQDETLSSHRADSLTQQFPRSDRDSRAAAVVLQDYLDLL